MNLRFVLLASLGLFFSVSHVLSVNVGVTLKIPELIILIFLAVYVSRPKLTQNLDILKLYLLFAVALVVSPLISNIYGLTVQEQTKIGSALMGNFETGGRENPSVAPWILLMWNVYTLLTILAFSRLESKEIHVFFRMLFVSLFIASLYGLFHGFSKNLLGSVDIPWPGDSRHGYPDQLRIQSFFIEPLNFAHFLIYIIPLYFSGTYYFEGKMARLFFQKVGAVLCVLCFFLTLSTSAAISFFVGALTTMFFIKKFPKRNIWNVFIATALFLGVAFLFAITRSAFINKIILSIVAPERVGGTLMERLDTIRSGWQVFLEHPFFGVGLGNSSFLYPIYSLADAFKATGGLVFPFNEYVCILAEQGIVGLISFLITAGAYILLLRKYENLFSRAELLFFLGGFISTLTIFQFTNIFNVYFVWVFVGISIALIQNRSQSKVS